MDANVLSVRVVNRDLCLCRAIQELVDGPTHEAWAEAAAGLLKPTSQPIAWQTGADWQSAIRHVLQSLSCFACNVSLFNMLVIPNRSAADHASMRSIWIMSTIVLRQMSRATHGRAASAKCHLIAAFKAVHFRFLEDRLDLDKQHVIMHVIAMICLCCTLCC